MFLKNNNKSHKKTNQNMTQAAYSVRAIIICHNIFRLMTLTSKKKEKKTAATTKMDSVEFNHFISRIYYKLTSVINSIAL